MASQGSRRNGYMKIRLTVLCAKNLAKKDFFRLPDPFAKITVDGSGQVHSTEACRATLDPKWNQHYDLYIGQKDSITISIWNHKKIHKKQGAGFMGCVRIMANAIQRIKDTGFQRLDLQRRSPSDAETVHGQIVLSLISRDRTGLGPMVTDVEAISRDPGELPEGWEERRTAAGRIHYVNHFTRTTQWDRPTRPAVEYIHERPTASSRSNDSTNAAARLCLSPQIHVHPAIINPSPSTTNVPFARDNNQILIAQPMTCTTTTTTTIAPTGGSGGGGGGSGGGLVTSGPMSTATTTANTPPSRSASAVAAASQVPSGAVLHRERRRSTRHRNYLNRSQLHQAVDLPDGYEQRTTSQGQVYYLHLQTGISTWHDPRVPRDLGNIETIDLGTLPPGWEARQFPGGRVYYVNHNNRTTQFTDPRFTQNPDVLRRILSVSPSTTVSLRDDGPPPPRHPPQAPPSTVLQTGYDKENESPVPRYTRDLVHKMKALRAELQTLQPQTGHCRLEVSREEIFEESYRQVMKMRPKDLRKRLMVKFRGEEGLDYGGVAREWLYLLSHEMLNPYYGLFQYSRDDIYTLQINPDSGVNPEHLSYFHFVGRIMGIAIFHGHYIDGGFTMPFYKQLLAKPISLDDIEEVDPELHRSLIWILENDITDVIHNTFCVEYQAFGVDKVVELKPGGNDIPVCEDNKKEYVRLYVNWRFMRGIEAQFLALQKGFNELIPHHLLRPFDERELELMIGGLGKIDIEDWKMHTRLKHCTLESNIVRWFWRAVDEFDEEKRARLLQFVTGSSRVPLQGFKALQGSTGAAGPRLFTIHQVDISTDNLPKAHTCFNRIDIPPYEHFEKLLDKLTCAVEETCGFAVE